MESDEGSIAFYSDISRTVCYRSWAVSASEGVKAAVQHVCDGPEEKTRPLNEAGGQFIQADDQWFIQVQKVSEPLLSLSFRIIKRTVPFVGDV